MGWEAQQSIQVGGHRVREVLLDREEIRLVTLVGRLRLGDKVRHECLVALQCVHHGVQREVGVFGLLIRHHQFHLHRGISLKLVCMNENRPPVPRDTPREERLQFLVLLHPRLDVALRLLPTLPFRSPAPRPLPLGECRRSCPQVGERVRPTLKHPIYLQSFALGMDSRSRTVLDAQVSLLTHLGQEAIDGFDVAPEVVARVGWHEEVILPSLFGKLRQSERSRYTVCITIKKMNFRAPIYRPNIV